MNKPFATRSPRARSTCANSSRRAAFAPGWSRTTRCRSSSLDFALRGGAAQDPAGKAGAATMIAGLLDEGAGDLDSQAFQRALDEKAIEISFHAERDHSAAGCAP